MIKTICYISNFSDNLTKSVIDDLIEDVNISNNNNDITGLLIVRNKHFFQILEGENDKINNLYDKIKQDLRHKNLFKLLDARIEDRIFKDYNSGKFDIFQRYQDLKKLHLYFNWIKNANYLPAEELIHLTTNFLKHNK
ncbi:BLUF domain-containing protein [Winogradskyella flava]|uniref:BLUF domain-containing protein n=1 Tax=Winogradskyella flava TaxID=1884876 RepID=A0A842IRU6_9FLAO|nr:BLUF domain-containing protein [Winogradskyella flava]MBC2844503.1 BLUF domain-containing protein [Winogradskyella flava]